MSERLDPVMKLAQHQPSRALPSGWSVARRADKIVLSGPLGELWMDNYSGDFKARLFYALLDDILKTQGNSSW